MTSRRFLYPIYGTTRMKVFASDMEKRMMRAGGGDPFLPADEQPISLAGKWVAGSYMISLSSR
ncbi:MAG: hypothetical protein V4689_16090 [Verrucomicrobiota bacterium]